MLSCKCNFHDIALKYRSVIPWNFTVWPHICNSGFAANLVVVALNFHIWTFYISTECYKLQVSCLDTNMKCLSWNLEMWMWGDALNLVFCWHRASYTEGTIFGQDSVLVPITSSMSVLVSRDEVLCIARLQADFCPWDACNTRYSGYTSCLLFLRKEYLIGSIWHLSSYVFPSLFQLLLNLLSSFLIPFLILNYFFTFFPTLCPLLLSLFFSCSFSVFLSSPTPRLPFSDQSFSSFFSSTFSHFLYKYNPLSL